MQTARIPVAVLVALGLSSAACSRAPWHPPCLNAAPVDVEVGHGPCLEPETAPAKPEDSEPEPVPDPEPSEDEEPGHGDPQVGPCLDVLEEPPLALESSSRSRAGTAADARPDVIARLVGVLPADVLAQLRASAEGGHED